MTSPQSPRFTARRMASIIGFAIAAFIYLSGFGALGATASGVAGTNEITSSNPVRNQIVQVQPPQIQMVFRDAITDLGSMGLTVVCGSEPVGIGLPQLGSHREQKQYQRWSYHQPHP